MPAPAEGVSHGGAPPILFLFLTKRECAAPGGREKIALVALRRLRASALYGGRREMVPAGLRGLSDGRGGVRCGFDSGFPRRGCRQHRAARTHLTSSSFRAFRSATRCPGSCRGLYQTRQKAVGVPIGADAHIGPLPRLPSTAKPAAAKREAIQCDDHPDKVGTIRHGTAVTAIAEDPSVPDGKAKSKQAPIRRPPSRAEGHCTGARPSAFFSSTGRGAFSFWARPKREWGAHPCGNSPWREPDTPKAAVRRPTNPPKGPAHQKFPQFAKTKSLSNFSKE